jgi:pyruvate kinase
MVAAACRTAVEEGYGRAGDQIAIAAGMPFRQAGTTNLLRIADL